MYRITQPVQFVSHWGLLVLFEERDTYMWVEEYGIVY